MHELYHRYMNNAQDRTAAITTASFLTNALIGAVQLLLGIFLLSPWYIANSVYYLLLCVARGCALRRYKIIRTIENERERYDAEFDAYKCGGLFIFLLGVSYSGVCLWMFFTGESRVQSEMPLALTVATVAFVKTGFAIHGMIINRQMHDPLISLIKMISFSDAMVSIVITQRTLLTMTQTAEAVGSSAIFGMGVSILFMIIGVRISVKKKKYPPVSDLR